MNTARNLISLCLLLFVTACMSDENKTSASSVTMVVNELKTNSTETQLNTDTRTVQPQAQAQSEKPMKRPIFKDFIEGGTLLKKIKTSFIKPKSWLVLYETSDEYPQLQVILLSPGNGNQYQKTAIDTFNFDGAAPQVKEIFFTNVDQDENKELVILCTWDIKHYGLGIDATDYKVSIYDNQINPETNTVLKKNKLMEKFGTGMEGEVETQTKTYQWKDKASILKAIKDFSQP